MKLQQYGTVLRWELGLITTMGNSP